MEPNTLLYCVSKFLIFQGAGFVAPGKYRSFSGLRLSLLALCLCPYSACCQIRIEKEYKQSCSPQTRAHCALSSFSTEQTLERP